MPTSFWLNATGNYFFRTNILCVGNSKIHQIFNSCIAGNDSVIIILVNDIEDVCQYENLRQKMSSISVLQQQLISNVNHRNETTYLILSEEALMESINDVKEITEKITKKWAIV